MKKIVLAFVTLMLATVGSATPIFASNSIQLRPLMYRESLTPGQVKQGALDIANPSDSKQSFHISVKLFRQIDDNGSLQFYDQSDVTAGITPAYTDFDLNAKDAFHLTFTVDSTKLPQGDVFAAILVTTQSQTATDKQAILPAVQAGTLLILQNGNAGPRHAQLSHLNIPFMQVGGSSIHGTASVTNPADANQPTGFFPQMKVAVSPWGATTQFDGPLVYAGRTRTFDFSVPSDQFGIYKVTVTANDATADQYVFVMTGKWAIIAPVVMIILVALVVAAIWWWKRHRRCTSRTR